MGKLTERLELRVTPTFVEILDEWRRAQRNTPSRGEAVRRLVEIGMRPDAAHVGV